MADAATTEKKVETKAEKFIRIASKRTENALDALANLRGVTAKASYEWTPEQAAKIMGALEGEMTRLGEALKGGTEQASSGFSL